MIKFKKGDVVILEATQISDEVGTINTCLEHRCIVEFENKSYRLVDVNLLTKIGDVYDANVME